MKDADTMAAFGWAIWHGHPNAGGGARRHDEIELVFVENGPCEMEIGTAVLAMKTGAMAAFWAMTPHKVTHALPDTLLYRVTVPVHDYLQWQLPLDFTRELLGGEVVAEQDPTMQEMDRSLFRNWLSDFSETSPGSRVILHLEIQARLHRLAMSAHLHEDHSDLAVRETLEAGQIDHAMVMGRYIAEHYMEPIHDADIARAANLNAQYAIRLFSRTFGVSMHKILNRYRISHACWLLTTTNRKVINVAMETGFGSMSCFYESFTRACGQSPHEYRAAAAKG